MLLPIADRVLTAVAVYLGWSTATSTIPANRSKLVSTLAVSSANRRSAVQSPPVYGAGCYPTTASKYRRREFSAGIKSRTEALGIACLAKDRFYFDDNCFCK